MARAKKQLHGWVYLVWGVNIVAALGVMAFFGFSSFTRNSTRAAPPKTTYPFLLALEPTSAAAPTRFYLPTVTRNPRSTPIEAASATPLVLNNGLLPSIVGFSATGHPIDTYTFGQGEREYLIVAGIHGGSEWNTVALANELIVYLSEHPETIPGDATLYIIRNMNPDGEIRAHGYDGRVNVNGVDLNRNFPTNNWIPEWDRDGCWNYRPTTGGAFGGSEPETRTIMSFIENHDITALISYHSAALGVFPGGVPWEEPSKRLAKALARVTGYPYPPLDTGCEYTGTLADWAVEHGIGAAVDMELSNHRDTDFDENLRALRTLLNFAP